MSIRLLLVATLVGIVAVFSLPVYSQPLSQEQREVCRKKALSGAEGRQEQRRLFRECKRAALVSQDRATQPSNQKSVSVDEEKKVIEGVISEYGCGDNCYLTIIDSNHKEHIGLCTASLCQKWNEDVDMPTEFKGKKVKVTVGKGVQYDGGDNVAGEMDAFDNIELLNSEYIYFAADAPPTDNVPTEAPLCYRFEVVSLEEQLSKLKTKYPNLYSEQITDNPDGSHSLTAKRKDDQGKEVSYFYSSSPTVCNEYQKKHLNLSMQTVQPSLSNSSEWRKKLDYLLMKEAQCKYPDSINYHQFDLHGQSGEWVFMVCPFEGGNSSWAAGMIVFHEGNRINKAIVYGSSSHSLLMMADDTSVTVENGQLIYEGIAEKPEDSHCCPTGRLKVSVDLNNLMVDITPIGFEFEENRPVKGRRLRLKEDVIIRDDQKKL